MLCGQFRRQIGQCIEATLYGLVEIHRTARERLATELVQHIRFVLADRRIQPCIQLRVCQRCIATRDRIGQVRATVRTGQLCGFDHGNSPPVEQRRALWMQCHRRVVVSRREIVCGSSSKRLCTADPHMGRVVDIRIGQQHLTIDPILGPCMRCTGSGQLIRPAELLLVHPLRPMVRGTLGHDVVCPWDIELDRNRK